MNKHALLALTVVGAGLMIASPGHAGGVNTIAVTTTVDTMDGFDQLCSLREAIHNARTNTQFSPVANECPPGLADAIDEIVLVGGSTYDLTIPGTGSDQGDLDLAQATSIGLDLRIVGQGAEPARIRQTIAGQRVLEVVQNGVEMVNLVVTGGNINSVGGGIYNNGDLALRRVGVIANTANSGGGIYNAGRLTITDSEVRFNTASDAGGGVHTGHTDSALTVRQSLIGNNIAPQGGGINAPDGTVLIDNASLLLNQASNGDGGAIHAGSASVTISHGTVAVNTASGSGGGLWASVAVIGYSQFSGNTAAVDGGAVSSPNLTVQDSSFTGNSAGQNGGGIDSTYPALYRSIVEGNDAVHNGGGLNIGGFGFLHQTRVIDNLAGGSGGGLQVGAGFSGTYLGQSEISGNAAGGHGGGIHFSGGTGHIINTTITGNGANSGGGGLYIHEDASIIARHMTLLGHLNGQDLHKYGSLTMGNSIISTPGQPDCLMGLSQPTIISLGGNIADDSSCFGLNQAGDQINTDPMADALDFHGGITRSYSLLPGSPAIDAGNATVCGSGEVDGRDQRGALRPVGAGCDIGAHERNGVIDHIFFNGFDLGY